MPNPLTGDAVDLGVVLCGVTGTPDVLYQAFGLGWADGPEDASAGMWY